MKFAKADKMADFPFLRGTRINAIRNRRFPSATRSQQRDYWVAVSETAGTLSIFCTQMDDGELAWFLDGAYA